MSFVFFGFENLPEIRISFFALESIVSIEEQRWGIAGLASA
jgi:hypothetical protein